LSNTHNEREEIRFSKQGKAKKIITYMVPLLGKTDLLPLVCGMPQIWATAHFPFSSQTGTHFSLILTILPILLK